MITLFTARDWFQCLLKNDDFDTGHFTRSTVSQVNYGRTRWTSLTHVGMYKESGISVRIDANVKLKCDYSWKLLSWILWHKYAISLKFYNCYPTHASEVIPDLWISSFSRILWLILFGTNINSCDKRIKSK